MKKFYLIFLLSLTLFLTFETISFANVSEEYITYCLSNLYVNGDWGGQATTYKNAINSLTSSDIIHIKNHINSQLSSNNLSNLNDYNLICLTAYGNASTIDIYWLFSNCSVQNGIENLGFLYLSKYNSSDYFGCYPSSGTDYIYYIKQSLTSSSSNLSNLINTNAKRVTKFWNAGMYFNPELTVAYNKNVSVLAPASIYITYPFNDSSTQNDTPVLLRNYSAYIGNDAGTFIPNTGDDDGDDNEDNNGRR